MAGFAAFIAGIAAGVVGAAGEACLGATRLGGSLPSSMSKPVFSSSTGAVLAFEPKIASLRLREEASFSSDFFTAAEAELSAPVVAAASSGSATLSCSIYIAIILETAREGEGDDNLVTPGTGAFVEVAACFS